MIVKPFEEANRTSNRFQQAGHEAERQMAHYLHRSFSNDQTLFVLHGLRLENHSQPEHDGSPGVCQIDHLLVHRFGFFIIECKSVTGEIEVRSDGSDGDEWARIYRNKKTGIPSPIRQARRQADILRTLLQSYREELLGRHSFGFRTMAKVVHGTDQRGFKNAPIQILIAISDQGNIKRLGGWEAPSSPFRVYVSKADLIPDKIVKEVQKHNKGSKAVNKKIYGEYGLWSMEESEAPLVAAFLAEQHLSRPHRTMSAGRRPAGAVCKYCGSEYLIFQKRAKKNYSDYWKCQKCQKNTPISSR